ncbi:MAG: hypothetical protein KKB88_00525 [Nanoarchaeota archaeon]|nr:hypothetical protein [Nanoarchaeota archaeon]
MNILNIGSAIGVVALVIMVIALFMKSKKSIKVAKVSAIFGVIGVLLLIPVVSTFLIGSVPFLGNDLNLQTQAIGDTTTGEIPATTQNGVTLCAVEDTTVVLSALNKETSIATGGTHRYKINGDPVLTVSNAGSFTASPGDKISILWMNGSETDSNYFSEISNEVVPCKGTKTFTKNIYSNGTVTFEVFNEENDLISGNTINETVSNGDVVDLDVKIKTQYQKAQEYGGIIVFEYASAMLDDVVLNLGGNKVSTPEYYHVNNGSQTTRAYSVPAFFGTTNVLGTLHIDVDDSRDPTGVPTDVINWTYYSNDYFINEDTGASWELGVQDEDSAQTKKYTLIGAITFD